MKYRVLSLPFDPETGFDDTELVALCADHEVVQMREHWFEHGDRPWLGLLLSFHDDDRPRRQAGQREERKASRDPRRGLSALLEIEGVGDGKMIS